MTNKQYGPAILGSESIVNLMEALSKCQAEMTAAKKTKTNYKKGKYADLDECWDTCRVPLTKHGLTVTQWPYVQGTEVSVTTMLAHKTGEYLCSMLTLQASSPGPQEVGASLTYARRYGLCAAIGITAEDDDDARSEQLQHDATRARAEDKAPHPRPGSVAEPYTGKEEQKVIIKNAVADAGLKASYVEAIHQRALKFEVSMLDLIAQLKEEIFRCKSLTKLFELAQSYNGDVAALLKAPQGVIVRDWTNQQIESAIDVLEGQVR